MTGSSTTFVSLRRLEFGGDDVDDLDVRQHPELHGVSADVADHCLDLGAHQRR